MRLSLIASAVAIFSSAAVDPPQDSNCVLNGFWQFSNDIIVRFHKVSDAGDWNASFYPKSQWLWYYDEAVPKEERLQFSLNATQSPELSFCGKGRTDTSPPYAMPSTMWWGASQEAMWGGQPLNPPTYQWSSAETESWDPSLQRCPVADIDELLGQSQFIQESGGCSNSNVKHLFPEVASLDETGYGEVSGYGWYYGMEIFVRRVVASMGGQIISDSEVKGFVPWYVGNPSNQSFAHMTEELQSAQWVTYVTKEGANSIGFLARRDPLV